ncbi:MAG TPA: hypothetical protein VM223_10985 [Planctomycetota bacterium]|nr:hypothetical protein [Planctomycetota bacterium]
MPVSEHARQATPYLAASLSVELPAPRNAAWYWQDELVTELGITRSALHSWIGRGLKVNGKRVKLQTLRAPKGAVAVGAVAEFFRRVNGVAVVIVA